ncbi:Rv1535 family protein [Mycobacterium palustre]|uniref:Uncharacterized protein n=1 Tax=Mycobacterium palustre TaxID=153971 RepID=A0A1X1ZHY1_9MYCO|nr:Rv1535 family protein [Mycobacterium palustre]MCV7103337.1 hypothetical protein [Mycobacterium palustre]ORW22731.1 hypothetical protein AWC19_12875 [Mycobacterium palustre]
MTAVLHDDVVTNLPAARSTAPEPAQVTKRPHRAPVGGGDPLVDGAARLLSIPLRQVYAVLWRMGLIEVIA